MKRWIPMVVAQVKPSSTIWAAVKTSPSSPVDLVVDGVVVGREEVEELHGQSLLLGQAPMARGDEAGHVLVGDGVVLAGLHARLALAQLGAPDPDELEDAPPEQAVLAPGAPRHAGHDDLRRPVGEDLQRDRSGVRPVGDALFDDAAWLRRPAASNGIGSILGTGPPFDGPGRSAFVDARAYLRARASLLYCRPHDLEPIVGPADRQSGGRDRRRRRASVAASPAAWPPSAPRWRSGSVIPRRPPPPGRKSADSASRRTCVSRTRSTPRWPVRPLSWGRSAFWSTTPAPSSSRPSSRRRRTGSMPSTGPTSSTSFCARSGSPGGWSRPAEAAASSA